MTRLFFPLRTSVELFKEFDSPAVVARAKQGAVLYDELIFESGLYDITVTPEGSHNWWRPIEEVGAAELEEARKPIALGGDFTLSFGKQDGPGVSAKEMHVAIAGKISARYVAEFQSGILNELAALGAEWVSTIPGDKTKPGAPGDPVWEAIGQLDFGDLGDTDLLPGTETFLRSFISSSFNRDSVIAAALGASFNITPLFAPVVECRGVAPEHAGTEALRILAPDVGALPWEAILEFRDHDANTEARARLREFERLAIEQEPEDAYEYIVGVAQEVTRAQRATIEDLAPNLPEELTKQALLGAVSLVPAVGAPVAAFADATASISASHAFNNTWISALMRLQSPDAYCSST